MKYNHKAIREECCQANIELPRSGLVDLTFGNVSVLDPEQEIFAIKPSGVPYTKLTIDDIVVLDLNGEIIYGEHKPSSDTPTHRALYLGFRGKAIRSIVHTHSRNAVAFAQAGKELSCLGTTHADHFVGAIPITRAMTSEEINGEYEWNTGQVILECLHKLDPERMSAIFVRQHGPFCWGPTSDKALENAIALEVVADMAIKTGLINSSSDPIPDSLRLKHFNRKHGPAAYYGQNKS